SKRTLSVLPGDCLYVPLELRQDVGLGGDFLERAKPDALLHLALALLHNAETLCLQRHRIRRPAQCLRQVLGRRRRVQPPKHSDIFVCPWIAVHRVASSTRYFGASMCRSMYPTGPPRCLAMISSYSSCPSTSR